VKLLLATTSEGKIREQRKSLENVGLELDIITLSELSELEPPEEPGPTFRDNAAAKALYYHRASGLATLGEDSGLVVDFLDGEPGVHSARWLGHDTTYDVKNARVVELLSEAPEAERTARYVSAVALVEHQSVVFVSEATCEGRIAHEPSGEGGFGYDPIFYYPPFGATMGELTAEQKNGVSHRGKAMASLVDFLVSRQSRQPGIDTAT